MNETQVLITVSIFFLVLLGIIFWKEALLFNREGATPAMPPPFSLFFFEYRVCCLLVVEFRKDLIEYVA